MMPGYPWKVRSVCLLAAAILLAAGPVHAQDSGVTVKAMPMDVGLCGSVRPGSFVPMRVTLENTTGRPRQVRCEWIVPDSDGDSVWFTRHFILGPNSKRQGWLYAALPMNTRGDVVWKLRLVDDEVDQLIDTKFVQPREVVDALDRMVATTGAGRLGLQPYQETWTQHERCRVLRGLDPGLLPDRWYGLSMLEAIIWTPNSIQPGASAVSPRSAARRICARLRIRAFVSPARVSCTSDFRSSLVKSTM
jgi:hypothetical protein